MKRAWALLFLGACASPSHSYLNPTPVSLGGVAGTWDAAIIAGVHIHPIVGSDCREILRLIRSVAAAATRPEAEAAAPQMAATMEAMISQTHGAPYGGAGKVLLHLSHFTEGGLAPDRSVFVVVPELRPEEQERSFDAAAIQAALHAGEPAPAALATSGMVHVSRRGPARLAFAVRLRLGASPLEADVEADVFR